MSVFTINTRLNCLLRNLLRAMLKHQVFKFDFDGEGFQLKSGKMSPIYIDLRECFGNAELMKLCAYCLRNSIKSSGVKFDEIVGVPYAALPYATFVAGDLEVPLIIIRKEAKSYGTKKLIEGKYEAGDTVIIIEDVVTTGGSIKTVVETLRADGLIVNDVFCLLDRDQGGSEKLKEDGITLHSLLDMKTILSFLQSVGVVDELKLSRVISALNLNYSSVEAYPIEKEEEDVSKLPHVSVKTTESLEKRAERADTTVKKRIFEIMMTKKTNICLAVDYTTSEELIKTANYAGPHVFCIKIHSDAVVDFSSQTAAELVKLADQHNFLIFEDRKFGDTGNTNLLQLKGSHQIAKWADIVTVHAIQGADSIATIFRDAIQDDSLRLKGVLLIAELSTKGSLTNLPNYTENVVQIGENNSDVVCGFICQTRVSHRQDMLYWTPGVNLSAKSDASGQQWRDINEAIIKQQNDIIIVGRGVTSHPHPESELKKYKEEAWYCLNRETV